MSEVVNKRVIRWDAVWGVALLLSNGKKVAYPVGSREEAERELLDPRPPDPNPDPIDSTTSPVLAD